MNRKEYLRNYQRNWMARRRQSYIEGKKCVMCDSTEKLEFDHIIPEDKKISISRIFSYKKEVIEKELSKCQILCYDCHLKKTIAWALTNRKHGRSWYNKGCRCGVCYKAQQLHNKQRNKPL